MGAALVIAGTTHDGESAVEFQYSDFTEGTGLSAVYECRLAPDTAGYSRGAPNPILNKSTDIRLGLTSAACEAADWGDDLADVGNVSGEGATFYMQLRRTMDGTAIDTLSVDLAVVDSGYTITGAYGSGNTLCAGAGTVSSPYAYGSGDTLAAAAGVATFPNAEGSGDTLAAGEGAAGATAAVSGGDGDTLAAGEGAATAGIASDPVAFRSASSNSSTGSSSVTVTKPTGVQDDDILIAVAIARGLNFAGSPAPTAPAGWTQIEGTYNSGGSIQSEAKMWWKRASSEGASYEFTEGNSASMLVCIAAYTGCPTTGTPFSTSSDLAYTTSDATVRAGTVTGVSNGLVVWGGAYFDNTGTSMTPPSGYTERVDDSETDNVCAIADDDATGATGNIDGSLNTGTTNIKHAWAIALDPA